MQDIKLVELSGKKEGKKN